MTCRDVTDVLGDYVAGDLGVAERRAVEARLAACDHCRRYLRGYELTIALVRDACAGT